MKSAEFVLHTPTSVEEAVRILSQVADEDGRIVAGGQTLVPAMALRFARPGHLVDINNVPELARLDVEAEALRIGACVRHAAFQRPVTEGPLGALLSQVVRSVAHLPIRNRGDVLRKSRQCGRGVRVVSRGGNAWRDGAGAQRAR